MAWSTCFIVTERNTPRCFTKRRKPILGELQFLVGVCPITCRKLLSQVRATLPPDITADGPIDEVAAQTLSATRSIKRIVSSGNVIFKRLFTSEFP